MRAGSTALAAVIAGLWFLAHPVSAQVVQITADQAALRVRYEKGARVMLSSTATAAPILGRNSRRSPHWRAGTRRPGVTFLAFSLDDDPEILDAYLGPALLPFDRQLIVPEGPGSLRRAFAAEGIRVPPKSGTPSTVVFDADGHRVGAVGGTGASQQTERWLQQLGFAPE